MRICINVTVFEWIFLPSSATNMVTQIGTTQFSFFVNICLMGFNSGFWMDYFAVFCHEYGYINNLFWKNGGWRLYYRYAVFLYFFFNRISSFWTDILTWTWMRICINVNVFLINILLSSTVNMVIKILYFGRMEGGDWYYAVVVLF